MTMKIENINLDVLNNRISSTIITEEETNNAREFNNYSDLPNELEREFYYIGSSKKKESHYDYPKELNILPAKIYWDAEKRKEIKRPAVKWKQYQAKRFPRERLKGWKCVCVVCGKISNNLLVFDFDSDRESKLSVEELYENIINRHPLLKKCNYVVKTLNNGFQFYFFLDSVDVYETLGKQGYDINSNKTGLKTDIQGIKEIDLRCEGNIGLTYPSEFKGKKYELYKGNKNSKPLKITNDDFLDILKSISITEVRKKPKIILGSVSKIKENKLPQKFKKMRQPFKDILKGVIDIEEYASKNMKKEFIYWKFLFREAYHYCGLLPEELYPFLEENQPTFDKNKTETQLKHHPYTDKPMTTIMLGEYFPSYKKKSYKSNKGVLKKMVIEEPKPKKKELTPEEIEAVKEYLDQPLEERLRLPYEIIEFYVVGEKERNTAKLIFFLTLGNVLSKNLFIKIDMHGDPSAGKSYLCDTIIKLIPKENYYMLDGGSDKSLRYDPDLNSDIAFIYLREYDKGSNLMTDLKSVFDLDTIWKVVDWDEKKTITLKKKRAGILTTYSFEYIQRDLADRAWMLIPDQSHAQTNKVINYQLEIEANKPEWEYKEKQILKKAVFFQNVLRYLREKESNTVISFAKRLKPLFSVSNLRVRRDVKKLPELIASITLFNQNNRKVINYNDNIYCLANSEDLKIALEIGKNFFLDLSSNLDSTKIKILDYMEFDNGIEPFTPLLYTTTEITEYLHKEEKLSIHSNTVRNKLKGLMYDGYISGKGEKKKAVKWRLLRNYQKDLDFDFNDLKEQIDMIVEDFYFEWKDKSI